MKDYNFSIKVSDVLLYVGTQDTIPLTNKFSTRLEQLSEQGMSLEVIVSHMNKQEVLITVTHATCEMKTSCDRCGTSFISLLHCPPYTVQAKIGTIHDQYLQEDILFINPKDFTIDIEDLVVDKFLLSIPIKQLCSSCETMSNENEYNDEQEENASFIQRA